MLCLTVLCLTVLCQLRYGREIRRRASQILIQHVYCEQFCVGSITYLSGKPQERNLSTERTDGDLASGHLSPEPT